MSTKYKSSKDVPLEVIVSRLKELSDAVTGGRESLSREFTMRIPAECDRDADLVIGEAASRLAKLQAECEKLRRDAERYRWLRDGNNEENSEAILIAVNFYGDEWDEMIDDAMQETTKSPNPPTEREGGHD